MRDALFEPVLACLIFAALALVVALVVAARFVKLWRAVRRLHVRFVFLEQTRGDARREVNRMHLRVAELEHRAGMTEPNVYRDLRKVRPVDFEADELADELAEADEGAAAVDAAAAAIPRAPVRVPRLGDRVETEGPDVSGNKGPFQGEVSVVDHVRKQASVTSSHGQVVNFPWEALRFVA